MPSQKTYTYEYSIADILNDFKRDFDDTFSNDVYAHFGMARKSNDFSKPLQYSRKSEYSDNHVDNYTKKQYNDFGWARDVGAITFNELDDMYSKIHTKSSLKKFPQSSYGEAIIEVDDKSKSTLRVNNVILFVAGTKNNPQITRVVKVNVFDENTMDILRKDIYEYTDHRALEAYASRMGEDILRYYNRDHYADYRAYTEKARAQRSGSEGEGNTPANRVRNQRGGADQKTQEIDSGRINSRKSLDDTSPRALLADAMKSVATNDIERKRLAEYKAKLTDMEAAEERLYEVNSEIKELSFAKGKRDAERLDITKKKPLHS